jgi:hypothetical protein
VAVQQLGGGALRLELPQAASYEAELKASGKDHAMAAPRPKQPRRPNPLGSKSLSRLDAKRRDVIAPQILAQGKE